MDKQTYYNFNPWWEKKSFKTGIKREKYLKKILSRFKRKQIEIITGSRRVGKTTILKQIIKERVKNNEDPQNIFYLSCDHPQAINISLSEHIKAFRQFFLHKQEKHLLLFFDEVQENPNWQLELKSLYDNQNLKIICSGSTSALVKSHKGRLTGRQIHTLVYPLDFAEFLKFKKISLGPANAHLLEKQAENYLQSGGYPEHVLNPSKDYLAALLDDILLRDIIRLYPIKNLAVVKDLFKILASSVGSRISYNNISNTLGLALDTVKDYINYLENAYLVKQVQKWSTSIKDKIYSQKKIYLMDTGLKTLTTGRTDLGFKAENAVYLKLLNQEKKTFYFTESKKEVDFIVNGFSHPQPIEVKYLKKLEQKSSKLEGIKLFLKKYPKAKKPLIITKNIETRLNFKKTKVNLIPLWQFLLNKPLG